MNGKNKIGDVIKRLMEIRDQFGDDIEVRADTQDGASYSVSSDDIEVETWERKNGTQFKVAYIQ